MEKILIVSTVSRQFFLFERGNIEVLNSLEYEIHCAANFSDANERLDVLSIKRHHFDIQREPFSLKNIVAYKQLKQIMKLNNFDIIHCHSPMGGVLARLAAKSLGITSVIYTVHGFHFYKGAPLKNWLIYYNVEKFLSKYTDTIITINKEDYNSAKSFNARNILYIPGIGIDISKFNKDIFDKNKFKKSLHISENTKIILMVGELIKRKNHRTVLKALANVKYTNYVLLVCGKGILEDELINLTKSLNIEKNVKFLGYRDDVHRICMISDLFVFPSFQEGLPVSVMEAMASGLPVIASRIRGNVDLINDGKGGVLLDIEDCDSFTKWIDNLLLDDTLRKRMGEFNREEIKKYDKQIIKSAMKKLYIDISNN